MFIKELFIRLTVRVFRKHLTVLCVLSRLVLRVGCGIWLILISDHCLSIYFESSFVDFTKEQF